ncbi:hypothetical protein D3C87_1874230 [compost metagenome]
MVMSRSPIASSERLPSSARSWPLVVCQKNGSKLSKPRSAICPMRSAACPLVALTMVPMRMDFAGLLTSVGPYAAMETRWPMRALSIAPITIARLLMLSKEAVSGTWPVRMD